ncbi:MAG: hypothetical protein WCO84_08365 [bacterium]
MKDTYDFECTPTNENCVQVSQTSNYMPAMRMEAKRMIQVCRILWPDMEFKIHSNPYDAGSYLSIQVIFDDEDERSWDRINQIEAEWPSTWDECNQRVAMLSKEQV